MAITKIMNIGHSAKGNGAAHLKNALNYIVNGEKTEEGILVGSVNCLPDFAFEQMIGTKQMFGKEGGRQGYHFVLSFVPEEGTAEQAYDIVGRFAEELLMGEYEAVYAVHTDKKHIHAHLIFNSVNMITGKKYQYKKGDWKYKIQPITNWLCEEHGLSIMPAEYSKDPINMSRKEWEEEKSWSDVIEADVRYCRGVAKGYEHFVFLLRELGYEVKEGVHLALKGEGMKRFRRIDTISEEYSVENLRAVIDNQRDRFEVPRVMTPHIGFLSEPKNDFQKKFHTKIYRMRVVEKQRFTYKSVKFKKDIERMHELQEEYNFISRKGIKSYSDLVHVITGADEKLKQLSVMQKGLYSERAAMKRRCRTEDDILVFLGSEDEYRKKLEDIKIEKKALNYEKMVARRCFRERHNTKVVIPDDVEIGNIYEVEVPRIPLDIGEIEKSKEELIVEDAINEMISDVGVMNEDNEDMMIKKEFEYEDMNRHDEFGDESDLEEKQDIEDVEFMKALYPYMTDKEKAEWIGIDSRDSMGSMNRFHEKLKSIGIVYDYLSEETDEYLRLERVVKKEMSEKVNTIKANTKKKEKGRV